MAVIGLDQLTAALRALPDNVMNDGIRGALAEGAKVAQRAITAAAPPKSEKDRPNWPHTMDSVVIYERKPKSEGDIGVRTSFLIGLGKKNKREMSPQGYWLEHGRRGGYEVRPKRKKWLSWIDKKSGKRVFAKKTHPGPESSRPWLNPAFDSAIETALKAILNYLQGTISKAATRGNG